MRNLAANLQHTGVVRGHKDHPSLGSHLGRGYTFLPLCISRAPVCPCWVRTGLGSRGTPPSVNFQGLCKDPRLSAGWRTARCDFTVSHAWPWHQASSCPLPLPWSQEGAREPLYWGPAARDVLGSEESSNCFCCLHTSGPVHHSHVYSPPPKLLSILPAPSSVKLLPWAPGACMSPGHRGAPLSMGL